MNIIVIGACSWFTLTGAAAIDPHPPTPYYIACRWDYEDIAQELGVHRGEVKRTLRRCRATVTNPRNGKRLVASLADWGPARWTGRKVDMSKRLMKDLGLKTNDIVQVVVTLK